LLMAPLASALAACPLRRRRGRCTGRVGRRRARGVARVSGEQCLQFPKPYLQLLDAGTERGLLPLQFVNAVDADTEGGVLPLQFVDAIVAPVTCHDDRSSGRPWHPASKRTYRDTACRLSQSGR